MVVSCSAYNCKERYVKGSGVTFHKFPKAKQLRKLWVVNLQRKEFVPTETSKICSKHFTKDCFDKEKFGRCWLKHDAVPTIFNFPKHLKPKVGNKEPTKRIRLRESRGTTLLQSSDPSILEDQEHPDWVPCTEPSYDKSAKLSQLERYRRRTLRRAILQACLPHSADKTKLDLSSHSSKSGAEENQTDLSKFRVKVLDDDDDDDSDDTTTSEEELQDAHVRSVCIQTEITMNELDKIHSRTNTLTLGTNTVGVPQIKPENYAKRIKIPAFRNCSKKLIFTNVCTVSLH